MTVFNEAHQAVRKCKLGLMIADNTVFLSSLLANLRMIIDESKSTAATDGVHMWLNPKFVLSLDPAELLFLILHEIMHCALQHMDRRMTANLDLKVHNMAADYYINLYLVKMGYTMPRSGGLMNYKYDGMSTREIYDELMLDPPEDDDYDQDIIIVGSNADDPANDSGLSADELAEQATTNVIKATQSADLAGEPGTVPGDVRSMLEKIMNPQLPWNAILQNHMAPHAKDDYSMSRPNKRFLPEFYLPVMKSEALNALFIGRDVSGSMYHEWLEEFMSEMQYIWDTLKPREVRVMDVDTEVQSDKTYALGDEFDPFELTGGGGTEMSPFIELIRAESPEVAIIFTDGEFYMPDLSNLYTDLIWVIINDPSWTADYGTVIHYEGEY
ncbi:MAG: hypothetical protein DRI98_08590 [Bacteroidetes bacterium]|nr:MAG: hypothetical protein DRI98_08590 [Bacteroidota bacterium]